MKVVSELIILLGIITCSYTSANTSFRGAKTEQSQQHHRTLYTANPDSYDVIQGEKLKVDAPGFLGNDFLIGNDIAVLTTYREVEPFNGYLRIKHHDTNGKFEYTAPTDSLATDKFIYTACQVAQPTLCANGTVSLVVKVDPNRPTTNPVAVNDNTYTIMEGQELFVQAPGFLGNDRSGTPTNPLERCDRGGDPPGDLDTHTDGRFEYQTHRCGVGRDTFTYTACYQDYPDLESNTATVTINVVQDPNRPNPPGAVNDFYTVFDNEDLTVDSNDGLLWNDAGGNTLFVSSETKQGGFEGDLHVRYSGGFEYTPVYGKTGTFRFTYEVCYDDWDCVACRSATVSIEVKTNPNKPASPPTPVEDTYEAELGVALQISASDGVLANDDFDGRYSLTVTNYNTANDFVGTFSGNGDGSFEYGNGPVGETTVTYTVCYNQWPDLCADGQIKLTTVSRIPSDSASASRRGVATFYEINWAGRPETECDEIEPTLTLRCGNGTAVGELNLLDFGVSDNSICTKSTTDGTAYCTAKHSGVIYAECRDGTSGDNDRRQLIVEMKSEPVACDTTDSAPFYWTHHSMWLNTWCSNNWVNQGIANCTGTVLQDTTGVSTVCYDDDATLDASSQPSDITMRSTGYETCLVGQSLAPPLQPATLVLTGNDGNPGAAFPLQNCQGDCDSDVDCNGGLICSQRDGDEPVPGCVGTPETGRDYCITPAPTEVTGRVDVPTVPSRDKDLTYVGNNGEPVAAFRLQECQGDCDSDNDCDGDLICFMRDELEAVPGCNGDGHSGSDYCAQPPVATGRGGPSLFP